MPLIQPLDSHYLTLPYTHSPPHALESERLLFQQAYRAGFEHAPYDKRQLAIQAQNQNDLDALLRAAQGLSQNEKLTPERKQFWLQAVKEIAAELNRKKSANDVMDNVPSVKIATPSQPFVKINLEDSNRPLASHLTSMNILFYPFTKLDAAGRKMFLRSFSTADKKTRLHVLGGATADLMLLTKFAQLFSQSPYLTSDEHAFWLRHYDVLRILLERRTGQPIGELMQNLRI